MALVGARSTSRVGTSNPKLYFGKNNLEKFSALAAQKPRENVRKRKKEEIEVFLGRNNMAWYN